MKYSNSRDFEIYVPCAPIARYFGSKNMFYLGFYNFRSTVEVIYVSEAFLV